MEVRVRSPKDIANLLENGNLPTEYFGVDLRPLIQDWNVIESLRSMFYIATHKLDGEECILFADIVEDRRCLEVENKVFDLSADVNGWVMHALAFIGNVDGVLRIRFAIVVYNEFLKRAIQIWKPAECLKQKKYVLGPAELKEMLEAFGSWVRLRIPDKVSDRRGPTAEEKEAFEAAIRVESEKRSKV